jgi:hypothetical protein
MSLDKAIEHGKEKRKPYRGAKAVDPSCVNHGSCPLCQTTRKHKSKKQLAKTEGQEQEYIDMVIGVGDPTDVEMDMSDELMERFGFDPNDRYDMVRSGLWWNPKIEEELKQKESYEA